MTKKDTFKTKFKEMYLEFCKEVPRGNLEDLAKRTCQVVYEVYGRKQKALPYKIGDKIVEDIAKKPREERTEEEQKIYSDAIPF